MRKYVGITNRALQKRPVCDIMALLRVKRLPERRKQ
jgi:hypothetical protein